MSESSSVGLENFVVIERVFDAPRELVWRAWTDPEQFVQWFGPNDFETFNCTLDVRVGGRLHFCMRSDQFGAIWSGGVFQEVEPPARLAWTDFFADEQGYQVSPEHYGMEGHPWEALVTVTFDDLGEDKTRLTLRHGPIPGAEHRGGADEGWSQSFDKLAAYLAMAGEDGRHG